MNQDDRFQRLVYIAGPISRGDLVENLKRANDAGMQLMRAGVAVLVPHSSAFWGNKVRQTGVLRLGDEGDLHSVSAFIPEVVIAGTTVEDWYALSLALVRRCDAILRLPGASVGADLEEKEARRLLKPVFRSVETCIVWATNWSMQPHAQPVALAQ